MKAEGRWGVPLLASALALAAALAVLVLDRETGLFPLLELSGQVRSAEEDTDAAARERLRLIDQIGALRSDPLAVEAEARDKLGMVREGEVVVRFGQGEPSRALGD
jgi:cell division protein FtsB